MRLQLLDKFGNPFRLLSPKEITLEFPYMGDRRLTKTLRKKQIEIIDANEGKISVKFSDFDINGLNDGAEQNFGGEVVQSGTKFQLLFESALHVVTIDGKKSLQQ